MLQMYKTIDLLTDGMRFVAFMLFAGLFVCAFILLAGLKLFGFLSVFVLLAGLKLFGVLSLSWWWVFSAGGIAVIFIGLAAWDDGEIEDV